MKHNTHHAIGETKPKAVKATNPKRPYLTAVHALAKRVPDVRALFDHFGHVRTITTDCTSGLYNQPMLGTPAQQATKFLDVAEINNALGLRHVELARPVVVDDPQLGHTVTYQQEVTVDGGVRYPVRGGFVQVHMDTNGSVFSVNSTLRHGRRNLDLNGIITEAQAVDAAKQDVGAALEYESDYKCDIVFSAHNGKIEPVYQVVLRADNPRKVVLVLVKAHGGEVVYKTNLLRSSFRAEDAGKKSPRRKRVLNIDTDAARGKRRKPVPASTATVGNTPVMGRAFLRIPDPKVDINKQVFDVVIESLPDPKVLRNDNFIMYAGRSKTPVQAKADGTFKYDVGSPEFCAVVVFFALNAQMELMKKWGMKAPTRPITVRVDDRSTVDNAYFDGDGYVISIGVGSGLNSGGLNRFIAYDLGVSWHENGHHIVYLQTPGQDLPGSEGGAIHESIGDVLGDLLMDWWFRHTFTTQLGQSFGTAEVDADPRIIGVYAMPPRGIRIAKNKKRTPQDKTGEVHDDGEISGAAKADLCVALVLKNGVPAGLELFGRMTLAALALVPSHRVTFRDLLNAYVTADQRLNGGANKQAIVKAFDDHGITLAGGKGQGGRNQPIIIVIG
jgi:Zn-dependent metalloprotease